MKEEFVVFALYHDTPTWYSREALPNWRLSKIVILPAFCLIAKIKSSTRTTIPRFYFCSGVECNQNSWFCKASKLLGVLKNCLFVQYFCCRNCKILIYDGICAGFKISMTSILTKKLIFRTSSRIVKRSFDTIW